MRTPTEFTGLRTLADKTVHRPGVHELQPAFARIGHLGIPLRAMDGFNTELHRQARPVFACLRLGGAFADITRQIDQTLFNPVRNQTRVGAMGRDHRRCAVRIFSAQAQNILAQTVVRAVGCRNAGIEIPAQPRLDAGVEIHHAAFAAIFNEIDARHLNRQVEQKVATCEQRVEHQLIVLARQRLDVELDAEMFGLFDAAGVSGKDGEALQGHVDMPQQQWQCALTDRSKTDDHHPSVELDVLFTDHLRSRRVAFWRLRSVAFSMSARSAQSRLQRALQPRDRTTARRSAEQRH